MEWLTGQLHEEFIWQKEKKHEEKNYLCKDRKNESMTTNTNINSNINRNGSNNNKNKNETFKNEELMKKK